MPANVPSTWVLAHLAAKFAVSIVSPSNARLDASATERAVERIRSCGQFCVIALMAPSAAMNAKSQAICFG
jgi:hypothetical protein